MSGDVVYMKTAKGLEEIEHRSCNLPRRLRSALIMIDGHTPEHSLRERFLSLGDPDWIIETLLAEHFISSSNEIVKNKPSKPVDVFSVKGEKRSAEREAEHEPVTVSGQVARDLKCVLNLKRCTGGDCVMSRGCLKFGSIT